MSERPLFTPDGRYFVIRGKAGPRLWRAANPNLGSDERATLVAELMRARAAVGKALRAKRSPADARAAVDAAKRALGERGPVWWDDGAPDLNRRLVRNTTYVAWWDEVGEGIVSARSVR